MKRSQGGHLFVHVVARSTVCEVQTESASMVQRVRGRMVTIAIVIGWLMMAAGIIYGMVLPRGLEEMGTLWPFYLGGTIAILLGRMKGAWEC
jgi:hypothetical protein